jgi:hypothetical protein
MNDTFLLDYFYSASGLSAGASAFGSTSAFSAGASAFGSTSAFSAGASSVVASAGNLDEIFCA